MRIEKCHFCNAPRYPGHGTTFVRNDAKVFHFCRSKCHKLFKQKRNPRRTKWTKAFRKLHGKELAMDSTLALERKTAVPITYRREIFTKAVAAIKRVQDIRSRRELVYQRNRLRPEKETEAEQLKKQVDQNIEFETHQETTKTPQPQTEMLVD